MDLIDFPCFTAVVFKSATTSMHPALVALEVQSFWCRHRHHRRPSFMYRQQGGDCNRTPQATGMHSQSVLQREVRAAVVDLDWPPLASRGWAPLPAIPSDEGEVVGVEGGNKLKVLSWNVLCDGLSGAHPTRGGFLKAPEGSLDWDKRRYESVFVVMGMSGGV